MKDVQKLKASSQSSQSSQSAQDGPSQSSQDRSVSPDPAIGLTRRPRQVLEEMSDEQYKCFRVLWTI